MDLSVLIKMERKFKPILFLDTLKKITISSNKSKSIFIYGDLWFDLDPIMQLNNSNSGNNVASLEI